MKRISFALAAFVLLFASCKENDAPIVFGSKSVDTTYVLSAAALSALPAQPHTVMVEEFTGQGCANCPTGHDLLVSLSNTYPGQILYVGLYQSGIGALGLPPLGSKNDFENATASNIATSISGGTIGSLPSAFIDRVPDPANGYVVPSGSWTTDITARMAIPDSVYLTITSTLAGDTTATITAKVVYAQPVSAAQSLSLYLVEDSIIDRQEDGIGVDTAYLFVSVFRDMITSQPSGSAFLDSLNTKEQGRLMQQQYTYRLPTIASPHPAIDPAHCRIVGFVNVPGGGNNRIMQAAQCKLMGP